MTTDLVLAFFSTPGRSNAAAVDVPLPDLLAAAQPINLFHNPIVVASAWPMDAAEHTGRFKTLATKARDPVTKRILPSLIKTAKKVYGVTDDIGRVAVVTFSAGRVMAQEILRHPADRAVVDTVIDIDGLNLMETWGGSIDSGSPDASGFYRGDVGAGGVGPWRDFGVLALDGQHLLVNWHTDIAPPAPMVTSTTKACNFLYEVLADILPLYPNVETQSYDQSALQAGPPPPSVTTPAQNDVARTWDAMPQLDVTPVGNAFKIHMAGNAGGAHIFSGYWGQGAVWRAFLAPRWNDPQKYRCTGTSGFGHVGYSFLRANGLHPLDAAGIVSYGDSSACIPKSTSVDLEADAAGDDLSALITGSQPDMGTAVTYDLVIGGPPDAGDASGGGDIVDTGTTGFTMAMPAWGMISKAGLFLAGTWISWRVVRAFLK